MTTTLPTRRELDLEKLVLLNGSHPPNDGMCVMEAVAYVAGEPHSDHPQCACPVIGAFARSLNDRIDDAARQALKPYIPRLVGSRSTRDIELKRGWLAADWLVHTAAPAWLRLAGLEEVATGLEALPPVVSDATARAIRPALTSARSKAAHASESAYADLRRKYAIAAIAASAASAASAAIADSAASAASAAIADSAASADSEAIAASAAIAAIADSAASAASAAIADSAASAASADDKWERYDEVYKVTRAAVEAKLAPTKALVQTSAFELLDRMLAVTE